MLKFLKWTGIAIGVIIIGIVVFAGIQWMRASSVPSVYEAEIEVDGISSPVRIVRDEHAVPHIHGETELDILFGLGFAHAQDRLWQMDLTRRSAQGRVSEILGRPALRQDLFLRTMNFAANVKASWDAMAPEDRRRLEAYAAGVNAWMTSDEFSLPAEYVLTMTSPEPWRPEDGLFIWKMLWFNLSRNFGTEMDHARLTQGAGPAVAEAYFRPYPENAHVAMAWPDLARSLGLPETPDADEVASSPDDRPTVSSDPASENSNNWVVAGSRSASGRPLLANDPHLALTMPGFWYLVHLDIPGNGLAGATTPGIPAILVGRNAYLAWGSTNNRTDVMDSYFEPLNPDDPGQYWTPDGWRKFEKRTETFRTRFSGTVTREYLTSRHGPVIPRDIFSAPVTNHDRNAVALSWTAINQPDTSLSAIMAINRARSTDEFISAIRRYTGPIQNIVFAHRDGTTGLIVPGLTPIRDSGHETMGRSPSDGAKAVNDWQGYVPPEMTPLVVNPASGALVTANARIIPKEYPYFRTTDWAPPSRQQRIQDLLDAKEAHDTESFRAIQLDRRSVSVDRVLPRLRRVSPVEGTAAAALDLVKSWDGAWTGDEAAPLIYAMWVSEFAKAVYQDEMGDLFARNWRYDPILMEAILSGELARWCDDRRTEAVETCDFQLRDSLESAIRMLTERYGEDMGTWRWSAASADPHRHLGLGTIPFLSDILSRRTPRGAGPDAPNVGYFNNRQLPGPASNGAGPSMRMIVDMANPEESLFITSSGQSGHFKSKHYDDLQQLWLKGEYIRVPTEEAGLGETSELVLRPAGREAGNFN